MIRIFLLLMASTFTIQQTYAQAEERMIRGIVRDAQSYEAVSIANISVSRLGTYTDLDGHFVFSIGQNDTLHISHISYYPHDIIMQEQAQDTLQIFLLPRINIMQEIVIRGLPSEEKFKLEMLQLEVAPSIEEQQAKANINFARSYFLSGYVPQMDGEDNYHWYIAGPQDVTIFSSGPSGGLFRALNNINRSKRLLQPVRMYQNPAPSDSPWQNAYQQINAASDSVEVDSLLSNDQ